MAVRTACVNLKYLSIMTITHWIPYVDLGKGPKMSTATIFRGLGEGKN